MRIEVKIANKRYILQLDKRGIKKIVGQKYGIVRRTLKDFIDTSPLPEIILSTRKPTNREKNNPLELISIFRRCNKKVDDIFGFHIPNPNDALNNDFKISGVYCYSQGDTSIILYPLNMLVTGMTVRQFKAAIIRTLVHEIGHHLDPDVLRITPSLNAKEKRETRAFEIELILLRNSIKEWMKCVKMEKKS